MTELRRIRILLIDHSFESISALSIFVSEIKNIDLDVVASIAEWEAYSEAGKKPEIVVFGQETVPEPQETFLEIVSAFPESHTIVLLPELDLDLGNEYREKGAGDLIYRLENYLGHLRHALRKALTNFWELSSDIPGFLQTFEAGREILHYRILELIGSGLRSDVFKAEDQKENRTVAIKILPPSIAENTVVKKRLIREAIAASNLQHPGIVVAYAIEESEGVTFLVMEYVEGESLARLLLTGTAGMFRLLEISAHICESLDIAHHAGRIHGNIKPGNILLTPYGGMKLLDFGMPQRVPSSLELRRGISGLVDLGTAGIPFDSLLYLSPEQTRGEDPDGGSDIFSLGALIYHASTGELPFQGKDVVQIIKKIRTEAPVPPSRHKEHLQEDFDSVVLKALATERTNRLHVASELEKVLTSLKTRYIPVVEDEELEIEEQPDEELVVPEKPRRKLAFLLVPLLILLTGVFLYFYYFRTTERATIVIFPVNSADESERSLYLSKGVVDVLTDGVSAMEQLRVIQTASISRYRTTDAILAAESLKSKYVISCQLVPKKDDSFVLELQMMEVPSGKVLWTASYPTDIKNIYSVRYEFVAKLAESLQLKLNREQQRFLQVQPSLSAGAIELYLQGRYLYYKSTREDLMASARLFDLARSADSNFAEVYSARALAYLDLASITGDITYYGRASQSATRALELREKLSEAHMVLGCVSLLHQYELSPAAADLDRALALNPSSSRARACKSMLFAAQGKVEASIEEVATANKTDPNSPVVQTEFLRILIQLRKYDEAISHAQNHFELLDPVTANMLLGDAYLGKNLLDEALVSYRRCQDLGSRDVTARIASVLAANGMKTEGRALLENMLSEMSGHVDPDLVAAAYVRLGNNGKAIEWLEKSYQSRSADLLLLRINPDFDPLREEPAFQKLLRLVGV